MRTDNAKEFLCVSHWVTPLARRSETESEHADYVLECPSTRCGVRLAPPPSGEANEARHTASMSTADRPAPFTWQNASCHRGMDDDVFIPGAQREEVWQVGIS